MMLFIPAIAWLAFISFLFLLPGSELPDETWFEKVYFDKWVHTGFFFVLIYLFYVPIRRKSNKLLLRLITVGLIYGIAIELMQAYWVEGRSFDLLDIVFDAVGCFIAFLIAKRRAKK